jgi:hypothetical protein
VDVLAYLIARPWAPTAGALLGFVVGVVVFSLLARVVSK